MWGGTSFGALSGGVGAELSGGDFWRGAGLGATVSLLNHYMHQVEGEWNEKRAINKRAKVYAKQAFSGVSLAEQQSGYTDPYVAGLVTNVGIYGAKGFYELLNNEFMVQAKFNNTLLAKGAESKVVTKLKVPGFIKFIGKWLGPAISVYGYFDTRAQYRAKNLTHNEMIRDQRSNVISLIPFFGTGWSLGFEPGMKCGPSTWYGKNDYKWFE
ncbi:hypothetical protein ACT3CE_04325 [Marinifilum sp. RC60d5]|uniref:hypothetical protein n=1 Tax=Marinifilum sp. RC60d5 TaxID=3458414 RepID=UPI0040365994